MDSSLLARRPYCHAWAIVGVTVSSRGGHLLKKHRRTILLLSEGTPCFPGST